jgi:hypothetical protein
MAPFLMGKIASGAREITFSNLRHMPRAIEVQTPPDGISLARQGADRFPDRTENACGRRCPKKLAFGHWRVHLRQVFRIV